MSATACCRRSLTACFSPKAMYRTAPPISPITTASCPHRSGSSREAGRLRQEAAAAAGKARCAVAGRRAACLPLHPRPRLPEARQHCGFAAVRRGGRLRRAPPESMPVAAGGESALPWRAGRVCWPGPGGAEQGRAGRAARPHFCCSASAFSARHQASCTVRGAAGWSAARPPRNRALQEPGPSGSACAARGPPASHQPAK